jgi:hypothetical protein
LLLNEIQNQNLGLFCFLKAKVTASYFDSHKTNFTTIDLIPIESKQLNTPFIISAQNLKEITPTNNPISKDLKQINMKKLYLQNLQLPSFTGFLVFCNIYSQTPKFTLH